MLPSPEIADSGAATGPGLLTTFHDRLRAATTRCAGRLRAADVPPEQTRSRVQAPVEEAAAQEER